MCGCEPGFTCSACRGTWLDDGYADLPEAEDRREQDLRVNVPVEVDR